MIEMYDMINEIRDGTLRLQREGYWDFRFRCKFYELYWTESRYGWAGDCLMEQRIRHPDSWMLTNRHSPANFAGWKNLEAWNISIYMCQSLCVQIPFW